MSKDIYFQTEISNVKDIEEFIENLKMYKDKGIRLVHSVYTFNTISIETLISKIEIFKQEHLTLEETCERISCMYSL